MGVVGLVVDGAVVAEIRTEVRAQHGETLMPHLADLLARGGMTPRDIDVVAVGLGPGSFTGVRIAMATAKGLALGIGAQLVGISTLDVLAHGALPATGRVVPMIDAHKNEIFLAVYSTDANGTLVCESPPVNVDVAKAVALVTGCDDVTVCGDGYRKFLGNFEVATGMNVTVRPEAYDVPSALSLAGLALKKITIGDLTDLLALEPIYVRGADITLPKLAAKTLP